MRFDSGEFGNFGQFPLSADNANVVASILRILDDPRLSSGCLLGGSRAAGICAEKSDVDLFVLCTGSVDDGQIDECLSQMLVVPGVNGLIAQGRFPWFGSCFTVFARNMEFTIDIGFIAEKSAATFFWEPTGIILWDDSEMIEIGVSYWGRQVESNPFRIANPICQGFMAVYKGLNSVDKGELFNAIELSGQARRALIAILRKRLGGTANVYYGRAERRVETVMSQELLARLAQTVPQYNLDSARRCLRDLAAWLVEVGKEACEQSENERRSYHLLVDLLHKN
jgi:hypothetical protein